MMGPVYMVVVLLVTTTAFRSDLGFCQVGLVVRANLGDCTPAPSRLMVKTVQPLRSVKLIYQSGLVVMMVVGWIEGLLIWRLDSGSDGFPRVGCGLK